MSQISVVSRGPRPPRPSPSPRPAPPPRWDTSRSVLTPAQAAVLMGCSTWWVYELITRDRVQRQHGATPANPFPYAQPSGGGGRILIPTEALQAWIDREVAHVQA